MNDSKLSSLNQPPLRRLVDFTKMMDTNGQSESMTVSMNCWSPASSGEDTKSEIKAETVMESTDYTGVELRSCLNRIENIKERKERKTGYRMTRRKKGILSYMKQEEGGERWNVKMEEDDVRDEEGLWRDQEKERDEQRGDLTDQIPQTNREGNNGKKTVCLQQEGEELSTLVTSFLLEQPRVLIRRLEITDISVSVSSSPHSVSSERGQRVRSPWRWNELSPVRGKRSLRQKGQVVTRKQTTIGQLERPLKWLPASSENGICAEASRSSPVITPGNQDTGQTGEASSRVFACSQWPLVHAEGHSRILMSGVNRAENPLLPSSTHPYPTPPKTLPAPTQSHTVTPGAHTCSQCGSNYRSKSGLTKHHLVHVRPHKCSQCGKSFICLGLLVVHQQTHTGERLYFCTQCGKSFTRLRNLKAHQRTHTGERPYLCTQCGKSFTRLRNLKAHQRTHKGERPYLCTQCGKRFTQLSHLRVHQRTHRGERPYHCSQCGKSFTELRNFRAHQRIHTGERPYLCTQCGKSFTELGNLKAHQRIHTGERPYLCTQCGKGFIQLSHLRVHQRTHRGERPYHCSQCGKSFTQLGTLKAHQQTHTGERPDVGKWTM